MVITISEVDLVIITVIDTGATTSLISDRVVNKSKSKSNTSRNSWVDNNKIKTIGEVNIAFNCGQVNYNLRIGTLGKSWHQQGIKNISAIIILMGERRYFSLFFHCAVLTKISTNSSLV
ncbi:hypothetical protein ACTA71_010995 [Dictyostelium dimigraforme]